LGELIVTDAIVWASLCIEHACHDIRHLPTDEPASDQGDEKGDAIGDDWPSPVEPPLKVQKRSGTTLPLSGKASPPCPPWGPSPPKAPPSGFVRRLAAADGDDIGDGAAVPKHQSHGQWARSCLDAVGIYKLPKQVFCRTRDATNLKNKSCKLQLAIVNWKLCFEQTIWKYYESFF
jgi:hypothetical protein